MALDKKKNGVATDKTDKKNGHAAIAVVDKKNYRPATKSRS